MESPNLVRICLGLVGGLAIFILGMSLMTQALNQIAGSRLKTLLAAFTKNRFTAAASGAMITAAVQSSSVTTVLLVGFSSVGLISVAQSVGVIFGANLGSTVTAQIIAFKVADAGAPLMAVGLFLTFLKKHKQLPRIGNMLLGFGAIFFGMQEMSDATHPLRSYPAFMDAMQAIQSPLLGIFLGLVFTAIVQSSAATIGLSIIFANQGLIQIEGAIALSLGANIGTCLTATMAAIGRPAAAWRVVFIHVIFNVIGVIIWFAFIPQLGTLSHYIAETILFDSTTGRSIAIANTVFNFINLLLFIGFTHPIAKLATKVFPEKTGSKPSRSQPLYLDPIYLTAPSMAVDRARYETGRLAAIALRMTEEIPLAALKGDADKLTQLSSWDDELDDLQTEILAYLSKIDANHLSAAEQKNLYEVIALANTWENIGDILDNHILDLGNNRVNTGLEISDTTKDNIQKLHLALLRDMRLAVLITTDPQPDTIQKLLASKQTFAEVAEKADRDLQNRLFGRDTERMELFRLETDLINNLKRVHYYTRRIGKIKTGEN